MKYFAVLRNQSSYDNVSWPTYSELWSSPAITKDNRYGYVIMIIICINLIHEMVISYVSIKQMD